MAYITGNCVDDETGEPIFFGVIKVFNEFDELKAETSTDDKGYFNAKVPSGERYKVCLYAQLYQPVCVGILDDNGNWVQLPETGRRIRINSVKIVFVVGGGAGV